MRVASKVGNLRPEFGYARLSATPLIRYVCDGRTTDKTNAYCPLSYGGSHWKMYKDGMLRASEVSEDSYHSPVKIKTITKLQTEIDQY